MELRKWAISRNAATGLLVAFLALLISHPLPADDSKPDEPLGFDLRQLKNIIDTKKPSSVEKLISELPASYRSQFTLMFHSNSSQGATPQSPRVILYGSENDKLLMAFTGKENEGGNRVEFIYLNPEIKKPDFYQVEFPGAKISKRNPERCMECHGSHPRPIR